MRVAVVEEYLDSSRLSQCISSPSVLVSSFDPLWLMNFFFAVKLGKKKKSIQGEFTSVLFPKLSEGARKGHERFREGGKGFYWSSSFGGELHTCSSFSSLILFLSKFVVILAYS